MGRKKSIICQALAHTHVLTHAHTHVHTHTHTHKHTHTYTHKHTDTHYTCAVAAPTLGPNTEYLFSDTGKVTLTTGEPPNSRNMLISVIRRLGA